MCCENRFKEKLAVHEAFVAALFYDYNGCFSRTFNGHRRFIAGSFGSEPNVDPVKMLHDFIETKLQPFSNSLFVGINVHRESFESLEYLLYADNGKTLLIEWIPYKGPLSARWLQ